MLHRIQYPFIKFRWEFQTHKNLTNIFQMRSNGRLNIREGKLRTSIS